MKKYAGKQSGFSLIEVVVSFTIFIIMGTGMILVSEGAFRAWENAKNKAVAYNIAQKYIELVRNTRDTNMSDSVTPMSEWASAGLDSYNGKNYSTDVVEGKTYSVSIDVVPVNSSVGNDFKRKVTVNVTWNERVGAKSLSADTYLTDWKSKY
jgi:type II secretory pathway pseudopilin PulG